MRTPFYQITPSLSQLLYYNSFFLVLRPSPRSTLFPYTTLFRSRVVNLEHERVRQLADVVEARFSAAAVGFGEDRKSTRLNSSHRCISYAVFCLKKKTQKILLLH